MKKWILIVMSFIESQRKIRDCMNFSTNQLLSYFFLLCNVGLDSDTFHSFITYISHFSRQTTIGDWVWVTEWGLLTPGSYLQRIISNTTQKYVIIIIEYTTLHIVLVQHFVFNAVYNHISWHFLNDMAHHIESQFASGG